MKVEEDAPAKRQEVKVEENAPPKRQKVKVEAEDDETWPNATGDPYMIDGSGDYFAAWPLVSRFMHRNYELTRMRGMLRAVFRGWRHFTDLEVNPWQTLD